MFYIYLKNKKLVYVFYTSNHTYLQHTYILPTIRIYNIHTYLQPYVQYEWTYLHTNILTDLHMNVSTKHTY